MNIEHNSAINQRSEKPCSPGRATAPRTWRRLATATAAAAGLLAAAAPAYACDDHGRKGWDDDCRAQAKTPFPGGSWSPGAPIFGSKLDTNIPVTMSDGAVLMVDVSYPTDPQTGARAPGPFPVLMTQTPYLGNPSTAGDYFVQRGYLFVTASVRGTRNSGGDFAFFSERDAKDGAELAQWAATKLQNSDGKVGLQGGSWAGLNQIYTAAAAGKQSPIKALAPLCFGAEFYRETYFAGGIPTQTAQFPLFFGASVGNNHGSTAYGQALVSEIYAGGPRAYDNDFWQLRTPGNYAQKIVDLGIPALIWSTHQDIYAESALSMYAYLQNAYSRRPVFGPMSPNQRATGRYQVLMSQGGHCQFEEQTTGQNIANSITLEWFDTWLKGKRTRMADTSQPLHVHELVSNNWYSTSAYPVAPSYKQYFLGAGGRMSPRGAFGAGKETLNWAQPGPGSTLEFDGPVLRKGATLAGPMSASFYASSSKTNLQLIASVSLVDAQGTVTPISSGAVLGSLASNIPSRSWVDRKGVPVKPYGAYVTDEYQPAGSVNRYDFLISPRFVGVPAGSRLRLTVTTQTPSQGSNGVFSPAPAGSQCSPVLGTDPCYPTQAQVVSLTGSTVTLHYGPKHPSTVNLPLLKAGCFKTESETSLPYWKGDTDLEGRGPCQELDDEE
ncbi:CocE/NonD family hydrolase [Variovorax guangxiensis]|uniref:CocE/NonD family hydrolase n=1 Tax=Variovorax guangxiensis TaxID=1775474 RepID=UPI00285B3130|nr:CocE/NonD family hydrolase [Variovorax guangxiensis]MDR6858640.1 putative acyl esterase [Variovorax guangxiensis]